MAMEELGESQRARAKLDCRVTMVDVRIGWLENGCTV